MCALWLDIAQSVIHLQKWEIIISYFIIFMSDKRTKNIFSRIFLTHSTESEKKKTFNKITLSARSHQQLTQQH